MARADEKVPDLEEERASREQGPAPKKGGPKGRTGRPRKDDVIADARRMTLETVEKFGAVIAAATPFPVTGTTIAANADLPADAMAVLAANHPAILRGLRQAADVEAVALLAGFVGAVVLAARADWTREEPTGIAAEKLGVRDAWEEVQRARAEADRIRAEREAERGEEPEAPPVVLEGVGGPL